MALFRTMSVMENVVRIGEDVLIRVRKRAGDVSVEIVAPRFQAVTFTHWPEGRRLEELTLGPPPAA